MEIMKVIMKYIYKKSEREAGAGSELLGLSF